MGIFDFFKKKKEEVKVSEKEIKLPDLDEFLEENLSQVKSEEIRIKEEVSDRVKEFIEQINVNSESLREINIEEKREQEQVKRVVKNSLNIFIELLSKLNKDLEGIISSKESNPGNLFGLISNSLRNFEVKSSIHYQKANYLVGKEIAEVIGVIKNFDKDLRNIFAENQDKLNFPEKINELKVVLEEYRKVECMYNESIQGKDKIESLQKEIPAQISLVVGDLEKIKKSKAYLEKEKKKNEGEVLRRKLEKGLFQLKEMVNFKELGNIHHSNEKSMKTIKNLKDNFSEIINESHKDSFLQIFSSNKPKYERFKQKLDDVLTIKEKLNTLETEIGNCDELITKEREMKEFENELGKLKDEKRENNKRIEKLVERLNETKKILRDRLKEMNVKLV